MENAKRPILKRGTPTVAITKPLVRTRVTYSRLTMSQSLRMRARYPFDEDIVQGRFDQLKTRNAHPPVHGGLQDLLRVRSGLQLRLNDRAEVVHALDERRHLLQEVAISQAFDAHRVLAQRFLDRLQLPIQYVPSLIDKADGIAHHLHLLHAVSGENDRGTLPAQLQHDILNHDGVNGVKTGEGLVQNEQRRAVNDRGNKLHLLLHTL